MNIKEVKSFLKNKPGYLKEGGKRLRNHLRNKGFETTIKDCKEALRQCREESRSGVKTSGEPIKVLIYDIETSPNIGWFWRAGYNQTITPKQIIKERAIICISYKWVGEDQVYNLSWDNNQCDKFLLEQFIEVLNEADLIVAHNGDRFDLKWIKTRALFHDLPMLIDYPQFDTLKVAKKKFNFNSNRLDYIAKLLGFEGKISTNINLWIDVVLKKDKKALTEMLDYCDEDVRQLEKVYEKLVSWEKPKIHAGVLQGEIKQTSPINGGIKLQLVKTRSTAGGTIKRIMKDLETDRLFEMSDTNYKKYIEINH